MVCQGISLTFPRLSGAKEIMALDYKLENQLSFESGYEASPIDEHTWRLVELSRNKNLKVELIPTDTRLNFKAISLKVSSVLTSTNEARKNYLDPEALDDAKTFARDENISSDYTSISANLRFEDDKRGKLLMCGSSTPIDSFQLSIGARDEDQPSCYVSGYPAYDSEPDEPFSGWPHLVEFNIYLPVDKYKELQRSVSKDEISDISFSVDGMTGLYGREKIMELWADVHVLTRQHKVLNAADEVELPTLGAVRSFDLRFEKNKELITFAVNQEEHQFQRSILQALVVLRFISLGILAVLITLAIKLW